MKLFWIITRLLIAFGGLVSIAAILPFAANHPAIENPWLVYLCGGIISLNIVLVTLQNEKELRAKEKEEA